MLAMFSRTGTEAPKVTERLIKNPLEERTIDTLMAYVLANTGPAALTVDSHWEGNYQIQYMMAMHAANAGAAELAILQELFDQLHFSSKLPRAADIGTAIATRNEMLSNLPDGGTTNLNLPAEFLPLQRPTPLILGGQSYLVTVWPVSARPSLSHIPWQPLWRYLEFLGMEAERAKILAAIICQWRGDQNLDWRASAADGHYRGLPHPYPPRAAAFSDWGELPFLLDVSLSEVAILRRHFVLNGGAREVNPLFFGVKAIAALADIEERTAQRIEELRQKKSRNNETHNLVDEIGTTDAAKYIASVSGDIPPEMPVIVIVEGPKGEGPGSEGPGARRMVVYDRRAKKILEDLE